MISSGAHRRVLVIGADTMSRIVDYTDRATCVIFGDGAGAMLLEPAESDNEGLLDFLHEIDGSGGKYLYMPAGGSRRPASADTIAQRMHYVHQEGQQVFKYAVRKMYEASSELLARNGLTVSDVDVLIAHQANRRIITAAAERLGISCDRVVLNIDRYGNTVAATIPLATQEAIEKGLLRKGSLALFLAVGAGYTVGASLWRWAY
jgi:3-oxoacyl-[acyl-carrier-protein] synthase-3